MFKRLFFVLLFFLSFNLFGQDVDQLRKKASNSSDSELIVFIQKKARNVSRGLFICARGVQLTSSKRIRGRASDHEDRQAMRSELSKAPRHPRY